MPDALPTAGPILDYASPRQRGKLRLPSQSVLDVRRDEAGVTITETLSGRAGAVGAIVFALITLLLLGGTATTYISGAGRSASPETILLFVIATVWFSELAVLLVVINNTWRRTVLVAGAGGLSLEFRSLFSKRRYAWPAERMEDVRVARMANTSALVTWGGPSPLGELQLLPVGERAVSLFTDHREGELHSIAQMMRGVMGTAR
jgi:hypothetical protein